MDKTLSARDVVAQLESGMTIGFGGWGPRRKPMALVREILRSDLKDLTIVGYGGPEFGMLCAAGKVRKAVFGFVTLDAIPLEPYFRKARESGALKELVELDEGMLMWGLQAAGMRVPFLPCRAGLATDIMKINPQLRTVRSPYEDAEELLAMPALKLDVALLHVDSADRLGNTTIESPDPFFDDLYARAADRCFVSCERLVDRLSFATPQEARVNTFERSYVTGVVHAPYGAHPTTCAPNYGWDMKHLKRYGETAQQENGWETYMNEFVRGSEEEYLASVGGPEHVGSLPAPVM